MCTKWTHAQWEEAAKTEKDAEGNPRYTITEYFNNQADRALLVAESDGWFYVVAGEDGNPTRNFYSGKDIQDARERAVEYLKGEGFEHTESDFAEILGEEVSALTYGGRTMAGWCLMGFLNEFRGEHVHPTEPAPDSSTEELENFKTAFLSSCTIMEALNFAEKMSAINSIMGSLIGLSSQVY